MATILNTHGTNPNALNGQFLPFDDELFADCDEGFKRESNQWAPIEELAVHNPDPTDPVIVDDDLDSHSCLDYTYNLVEEHFWDMALEAGLNPREFFMVNPEDQEFIIQAWIAHTYRDREHLKTGGIKPTHQTGGTRVTQTSVQCGCIGQEKVRKAAEHDDWRFDDARQPNDKGWKRQPRVTHMYP